jgi:hypothetical protein
MSTEEGRAKRAAEWKPGDAEYAGGFAPKCSTEGCDTQARWPHGFCGHHRGEEYAAKPGETKTTPPGSVEFKTPTGGV